MADDLDPKTAVWSGKKNMLIPYRTLIDSTFLRKVANSSGYNYNNDRAIIFDNVLFPRKSEKYFDTERNWVNAYIQFMLRMSIHTTLELPIDIDLTTEPEFLYGLEYRILTTDYMPHLGLDFKALSTGGIAICNYAINYDERLSGAIIKLRRVIGQGAQLE